MNTRITVAAITAATILAYSGCSETKPQATASPVTAQFVPSRVERLKQLRPQWEEVMATRGIAGMSVVVVHGDEVIYTDALGVRDPETKLPVTTDTMFYIASCTKSYMALGIMKLVEEGRVELDAPIKKYLPRFELADAEATASITVRDLLCHAKGVNSGPAVFLDAFTGTITEDRYYHWLKLETPKGSPDYTNVHFTLAGRIAEAITGESWKDYLEQAIFKPAGMNNTTAYADKMYDSDDVAFPCEHDGIKVRRTAVRKTDRVMHAAGGLGTSANDLGQWLRLNLNGGVVDGKRILSEDGITEMHRQQVDEVGRTRVALRRRLGFGLGWFTGDYQKIRMLDHGGGYVGTAASISFMPDKKLGVAVVANGSGAFPEAVAASIYQELLDLQRIDGFARITRNAESSQQRLREWYQRFETSPVTANALSTDMEQYVGQYANELVGTADVNITDGKLQIMLGDLPLFLATTSTDAFTIGTTPGSTDSGKFLIGADGRVSTFVFHESDMGELRFERQLALGDHR